MSTVATPRAVRNVRTRMGCPACRATGRTPGARTDCAVCKGAGKVFVDAPPPAVYSATQGEDVLDVGGPLGPFVAGLCKVAPFIDGDVVVWRHEGEYAPRAVAVVSCGTSGAPAVRWL